MERRGEILDQVHAFPSIPAAAGNLLKLLGDPESTAAQAEALLRLDPGLTANILWLTNSAYFGLSNQVGSIRQAVVLLGWKRVSSLVLTSCMNAVLNKPVAGYELENGDMWRHALAVSVAAEGLAKILKLKNIDEVFTAALLHDVGKTVLGRFVAEEIHELESVPGPIKPFNDLEQAVLGADHAEVGARILRGWSLPERIVAAVRFHHDPDGADPRDVLIDVVHLANVLCLSIGLGVGREGLQYRASSGAIRRLGLTTLQMEQVASRTLQWVNELSDIAGEA
ncbi:MAG: HDOD domain-containing protein [Desulfobacterales bacterium]